MAGRQKGNKTDWQGSAENLTPLADLAVYNEGQGIVCWIPTKPSPGRFRCGPAHHASCLLTGVLAQTFLYTALSTLITEASLINVAISHNNGLHRI